MIRTAPHIAVLILILIPLIGIGREYKVSVDKHKMRLGEQAVVHLKLTVYEDDVAVFPALTDIKPGEIVIADEQPTDTSRYRDGKDIKIELTKAFKITSFDTGLWKVHIPPAFVNGDTLTAEPFYIEIEGVEVDESGDFADIKPAEEFPYTAREILMIIGKYALIAWGILMVAAVIAFFIGKDKVIEEKKTIRKPEVPAHVEALKNLEELEKMKLWQSGEFKEYHIRLSEIARLYLERRFALNALESTTGEIERQMAALNIEGELKERLLRAFRISDLAKFAKATPLESENVFAFDTVSEFVVGTAPEKDEGETDENKHENK